MAMLNNQMVYEFSQQCEIAIKWPQLGQIAITQKNHIAWLFFGTYLAWWSTLTMPTLIFWEGRGFSTTWKNTPGEPTVQRGFQGSASPVWEYLGSCCGAESIGIIWFISFISIFRTHDFNDICGHTVDGRNPAPPNGWLKPYQLVIRISSIHRMWTWHIQSLANHPWVSHNQVISNTLR